jgi:hypothetical protein
MSPVKKFVDAAQARDWKRAYDECNGLPMADMLDSLQALGLPLLRDMRAQMPIFDVWGGPNMPRIRFAMDVVEFRKIPDNVPMDLPKDQVQDAGNFLKRSSGKAASDIKRIRIALFWTKEAQGEGISTQLVQKARDLLRSNNTGFELDVLYFRSDLDFKGEVLAQPDAEAAMDLARHAANYSPNRLAVIFCKTTPAACDPNRQQCARLPSGSTPRDGQGRPFVFINVFKPAADNCTLLHEIGHAAGIDSRDSDDALKDLDDIMSYGPNRTKVGTNQLNKLNRSGLFFVGR